MVKKKRIQKKKKANISKKCEAKSEIKLIVGVGASAGGLEAYEEFFLNLIPDSGMSFVVISHLAPQKHSYLVELIGNYTHMSVEEVKEGITINPDCIYVIPPNRNMVINEGILHLSSLSKKDKVNSSIDTFFCSMAKDFKSGCVGVLLSGTGSDGSLGLKEIKKQNGLTMVQDPVTAKFKEMPSNAILSGYVDHILPPGKLAKKLTEHFRNLQLLPSFKDGSEKKILEEIYALIKSYTGIDFTKYKSNSNLRQIYRHMSKNGFKEEKSYIKFLTESKLEVEVLAKSFLIGVTRFFRDSESFEYLKKNIIPQIINNKKEDETIRIWVCGCSTGQEAYSMAIILKEELEKKNLQKKVKIFATDINSNSIDYARKGKYPLSIKADVSTLRLEKFFVKSKEHYQIKSNIREMIVFATQDITVDPSFSDMDLTSCRNLLIYFNAKLQNMIMPLLAYSLNRNGFLFLSPYETTGDFSNLFRAKSRKHNIFQINVDKSKQLEFLDPYKVNRLKMNKLFKGDISFEQKAKLGSIVSSVILERFSPSGIVINKENEVIYYHGKTNDYLENKTGRVNLDLFSLIREEFKIVVDSAIRKARSKSDVITCENIQLLINKHPAIVKTTVSPLLDLGSEEQSKKCEFLIILFTKMEIQKNDDGNKITPSNIHKSKTYKNEIKSIQNFYEGKLKTIESTTEGLLINLDELQTTNEELQSSNEELETSREELQSINEELQNVISEQEEKVEVLSNSADDMNNLLASTQIGTIFLSDQLTIKRFTPSINKIVNLVDSDIGRPIGDFSSILNYKSLGKDVSKVLKELVSFEKYITTESNITYHMRIHPYRRKNNRVDGVVLTFVNVTDYNSKKRK